MPSLSLQPYHQPLPKARHAPSPAYPPEAADREGYLALYQTVRGQTEALAADLTPEDQTLQSMPDASPVKWHRAHTTWFFAVFVLDGAADLMPAGYDHLFNSYYQTLGAPWQRAARGALSRPTCAEIADWRAKVDAAMIARIRNANQAAWDAMRPLLVLGLNHEQQHQELILTDLTHALAANPLVPAPFAPDDGGATSPAAPEANDWDTYDGGIVALGHDGEGFAWDNEGPNHDILTHPFRLARRPVSNQEFFAFIRDAGYRRPELWLSDGWARVQAEGWAKPIYWRRNKDAANTEALDSWQLYTLAGLRSLDPHAPVAHLSYFEADAYAKWADARLPQESELERALYGRPIDGALGRAWDSQGCARAPTPHAPSLANPNRLYGDVWEWTMTPYSAYPGYRPPQGAIGEYNGKFMCGQFVLRGGSCMTPTGHIRASYRNFFPPDARWQMSGLRLAQDA